MKRNGHSGHFFSLFVFIHLETLNGTACRPALGFGGFGLSTLLCQGLQYFGGGKNAGLAKSDDTNLPITVL